MGMTKFGSVMASELPGFITYTDPIETKASGTYTGHALLRGLMTYTGTGAATQTLPSARAIIDAIGRSKVVVGTTLEVVIRNASDADITIVPGEGVVFDAVGTIESLTPHTSEILCFVVTALSPPEVTVYHYGTMALAV